MSSTSSPRVVSLFAFAFAASLEDGALCKAHVSTMLDALRAAKPDGASTAAAPNAAAGVARWEVVRRDRLAAPHWDPERGLLVAGDVRLYNRAELTSSLGVASSDDDVSDLDLVRQAYLCWGTDAPARLVGDFAFAIWDEARRALFAARDQVGVRPLYFHLSQDRLLLASDVRQLLPFLPSALGSINDHKILDRFTRAFRSHGRTFFQGITQMTPGHVASFDRSGWRQRRYWSPPLGTSRRSYQENCAIFAGVFRRAVRDRLESDLPLVAHSSGGADSSSILLAVDEVYNAEPGRPPLVMASALTPQMPCDDSIYMDAVARRVRFEGVRWSALDPELDDIDDPSLPTPGLRRGPGGGPRGDLRLAEARGARTLLIGACGDDVMYSFGILRDLARRGRWARLVGETVGAHPLALGARQLVKASLGVLPPALALAADGRLRDRHGLPPDWMGPRLRAIYPPGIEEMDLATRDDWPSHLACEHWARLTGPHFGGVLDTSVLYGSNAGIEVRVPYADVRLIEHVLTIPWQQRMPDRGRWGLRRDALRCLLPPEFAERQPQGSWSPVWAHAARHLFPKIAQILADGTWLAAPYVEREPAARLLREATAAAADPMAAIYAAEFGLLEAWLRQVSRYDGHRG